jgi:hypothetical protein
VDAARHVDRQALVREFKRARECFGLPEDAVVFVTSFETNSDPQRKYPFAVVAAFFTGVGDDALSGCVRRDPVPSR